MFLILSTKFEFYDYIRFFPDFFFPPKYAKSTDHKQVFWELVSDIYILSARFHDKAILHAWQTS